ncbi:MAG: EamA family transporter, partial [Acidobacteria bacterium]|nr:EamA family transporter [Acidobacteriota bacterium]
MRIVVLTTVMMVAFAANSILCRLALGDAAIDAASFTTLRLISGAIMLLVVSRFTSRSRATDSGGNWLSAAMLFVYAAAFSFAYTSLSAGTGALILFGAVQATMILIALRTG